MFILSAYMTYYMAQTLTLAPPAPLGALFRQREIESISYLGILLVKICPF